MRTNKQLKLVRAFLPPLIAVGTASALAQSPFVEVLEPGQFTLPSAATCSWGDYDNDGDVDLFVPVRGSSYVNHLYRNDGAGVFTALGESDVGDLVSAPDDVGMGVWGDIDNDGDLDLYLGNSWSGPPPGWPDIIYVNDGNSRFERLSPPGVSNPAETDKCVSLLDYDQDGLLDVFVTTWPNSGAGPDLLYRNEGALRFALAESFTPATQGLLGFWGDLDEDGDYDIVVGDFDKNQPSLFHMNQAAQGEPGTFIASTTFPNGLTLPNRVSDADWGDFDNDGDLDLLAGHSSHPGCDLFQNDGKGSYTKIDIPLQGNLRSGTLVWVDVDNDGWLDMLVETVDTTKGDHGRAYSFLRNDGGGGFSETIVVSDLPFNGNLYLPNPGDFNNDGFMDIFAVVGYVAGETGDDRLWRNEPNANHWLKLVLKGTVSNASAIGAIVRVKATIEGKSEWQMRQIFAGGKYGGQTDPRPNFGLREATVAEVVRIEWPSGTVQELANVATDQILIVVEPPRLKVESGGQLYWPVTADGYQLESANAVDRTWSEASETVQTNGNRKFITIQPDGEAKFYRLNGQ